VKAPFVTGRDGALAPGQRPPEGAGRHPGSRPR